MTLVKIGQVIQEKRKERGLTQSQLAQQIGLTKSSVSKWETGQTYPDIYLLPELATYFNMTVDDLLRYQPQLTKEEILGHYKRLAKAFDTMPVQEVLMECQVLIKKYYACCPFLLQMSILLVNHVNLAEKEQQVEILEKAIDLTRRVRSEAIDTHLIQQANRIEATCQLVLENPQEVLSLLGEDLRPYMGNEHLLAGAYHLLGQIEKGDEVLQASLYQSVVGTIATSGKLLHYQVSDRHQFDQTIKRIGGLIELYDVFNLHPFIYVTFLLDAFMGYLQQKRLEKALEAMAKIIAVLGAISYPANLHGDLYFDRLDGWIDDQLELSSTMPRNKQVVKESLLLFFNQTPGIQASFRDNQEFNSLLLALKKS